MTRACKLSLVALGLAYVLDGVPALAQDTTQARDLFHAGVEHLRADRFAEAVEALRASYALSPRAATVCNLALAYDRWSGHLGDAAAAYDRCAAHEGSERFREHAVQRAGELRAVLSAAAVEPPERTAHVTPAEPAPIHASVAASAPTTAAERPTRARSGWLLAGIATASVGGGVLALAIGFDLQASSDEEYLDGRYPSGEIPATVGGEPNPDVDRLNSARTADRWSGVLYASAGGLLVLGAGAITWALLEPEGEGATTAALAVRPVRAGAVVVLDVHTF